MDFRYCYYGLFYLLLQLVVYSGANGETKPCRQCKPGYHVSIRCSDTHDTVCKPCSKGFFMHSYNVFDKCLRCSKCHVGEFELRECTKFSDTVCASCPEASDVIHDANYARDCSEDNQNDQPLGDSEHGIQLTNGDNDVNGIYGGSGEHASVEDIHVWPTLETLEGSGETPDEDKADNVTYVVIHGDGVSKVTEPTTPVEGVIVPEGGIVLETDPGKQDPEVAKSSHVPSSTKTTISVILPVGGSGTELDDTDSLPEDDVDVTLGGDRPLTGASKRHNESSGGTSTGVVVTVGLVAAFVFFVLGFLASRYWSSRRERTFNVMEAERRNGSAVECSGIEYKDEAAPARKNHYEDAPTRVNGQRTAKPPPNPTNETPIVRESAQPTNAQPVPKKEPQETETREPPARPQSEIRYIDEEIDEVETDRLLPPPSASGSDDTGDQRASSSLGSDHSVHRLSDESEPMLSSDGTPNSGVNKTS